MARTKPLADKVLTIRLSENDLNHLEAYCRSKSKTKTEVMLGMIRRLRIPADTTATDQP